MSSRQHDTKHPAGTGSRTKKRARETKDAGVDGPRREGRERRLEKRRSFIQIRRFEGYG